MRGNLKDKMENEKKENNKVVGVDENVQTVDKEQTEGYHMSPCSTVQDDFPFIQRKQYDIYAYLPLKGYFMLI